MTQIEKTASSDSVDSKENEKKHHMAHIENTTNSDSIDSREKEKKDDMAQIEKTTNADSVDSRDNEKKHVMAQIENTTNADSVDGEDNENKQHVAQLEKMKSSDSVDGKDNEKKHHIRDLLGEEVLTVTAMALCYFFYLALLPPIWVWGATFFTIGILYLLLPYDLIPDTWRCGWLDNLVIGGGGMALGAWLMCEAHKVMPFPFSRVLIPAGIASLLIIPGAAMYKPFRKTLIGILALVAIPCVVFANFTGQYGLGISCLACGLMYIMLEIDIIPDTIPFIGKFDNLILGVLPIIVGLVLVALSAKDAEVEVRLYADL
jgi:uncharacterized membrane protein YkvA (DUF1232 family)